MDELHREELIAKLVSNYRDELAGLTDVELSVHALMMRKTAEMSDEEWIIAMESH